MRGRGSRRDFLKVAGVGAGAALLGCGPGADAVRDVPAVGPSSTPSGVVPEQFPLSVGFPSSVASGDVAFDSAILWARYLGDQDLELLVWEMVSGQYRSVTHRLPLEPSATGFLSAEVRDLKPGVRYRYAFLERASGQW